MLSVHNTAIAAQKVSPEIEEWSSSVSLVLSNTVLYLYVQVTNIRPRQTSGVVTTLTGNPPENTHSWNRKYIACSLRVRVLHGVQCSIKCVNIQSFVEFTEKDVSVSCSECLSLVTGINFTNIMVVGLGQGLCISISHTIFLLIPKCRSLKLTIDNYIVFPSVTPSKFSKNVSQFPYNIHFPSCFYPIPLTQSVVKTQFPDSLPFPLSFNPFNKICCQNSIPSLLSLPSLYPIPLTQSAVNTQFHHSLPFPPFNQSP